MGRGYETLTTQYSILLYQVPAFIYSLYSVCPEYHPSSGAWFPSRLPLCFLYSAGPAFRPFSGVPHRFALRLRHLYWFGLSPFLMCSEQIQQKG